MSQLSDFQKEIEQKYDLNFQSYEDFHKWTVDNYEDFWREFLGFSKLIFVGNKQKVVELDKEIYRSSWFNEVGINYAQNCLENREANDIAIKSYNEFGKYRQISYQELKQDVWKLTAFLKEKDVFEGDFIASIAANIPETITSFLATANLGAIWSSCSPEFGENAIIDRFKQLNPKVLFATTGYIYQGKYFDITEKVQNIVKKIPSLKLVIFIPYPRESSFKTEIPSFSLQEILQKTQYSVSEYKKFNFNHPLYILFSSGTTGLPKAIVHGTGRMLIQQKKELLLHCDLKAEDNLFFYTTCSWMMWNWMVAALTVGSAITLFDGNPMMPKSTYLFDIIEESQATVFGVGAKYISLIQQKRLSPVKNYDFDKLRLILTTGSPLVEENFEYIKKHIKPNLHISSISGGTDIASCFVLGNPDKIPENGYIQAKGLGLDVKVFDDEGKEVFDKKGDLVCASPFPAMPVKFLNDENYKKYKNAYFAQYPNIWCHGDYMMINEKGIKILGRSDTTLNPGGIRIGSAEIYRVIEKIEEVQDSLILGLPRKGDEVIYLFLTLSDGKNLDHELKQKITQKIKSDLSPKHVPKKVVQVPDIAYTFSGKKIELPIKKLLLGETDEIGSVKNVEALEFFLNYREKIS